MKKRRGNKLDYDVLNMEQKTTVGTKEEYKGFAKYEYGERNRMAC